MSEACVAPIFVYINTQLVYWNNPMGSVVLIIHEKNYNFKYEQIGKIIFDYGFCNKP